jgi:DNA-binding NtrC family response regulator
MPARILVVDDKLALAETLADGLADRGYHARALDSGREALAAIADGAVDVLVTDLRMPELDGFALVDAAHGAALPVIAMTGYGASDGAESVRRGAYVCLTKPFKVEQLVRLVARVLAR